MKESLLSFRGPEWPLKKVWRWHDQLLEGLRKETTILRGHTEFVLARLDTRKTRIRFNTYTAALKLSDLKTGAEVRMINEPKFEISGVV